MGSCSCDWDGETYEFQTLAMHKARKTYRCEECGQTISPGDLYERCSGKCDGEFSVLKTCEGCADCRKSGIGCNVWGGGIMWQSFWDCEGEVDLGAVDRLSPAGLAKLQSQLDKMAEHEEPTT